MKRFHFQLVPSIFFIVALGILLSLGTWQLKRLVWKNNLLETFGARLAQAPQALPPQASWSGSNLDDLNFRPVAAKGTFFSAEEVHLYALSGSKSAKYGGAGYWIITPFKLESGGVILVNTGFVPERFKKLKSRPWAPLSGNRKITGIIKIDQGANAFTPEDNVAKNIWFTRNIANISAHLNLKQAAPFMVALTQKLGTDALPLPRKAKITLANNHMGYAITWYGLACTLIGVFFFFSLKPKVDNQVVSPADKNL